MALIEWDDSLSVNVKEIDAQHQKLVMAINELNEEMRLGKGQDALNKILKDLISYAATHFKTEETYFNKYGYPDTERHKKEHTDFVAKVSDVKERLENGKLFLSLEVMKFLSGWLRNHIKQADKKYSSFFNSKGLT